MAVGTEIDKIRYFGLVGFVGLVGLVGLIGLVKDKKARFNPFVLPSDFFKSDGDPV